MSTPTNNAILIEDLKKQLDNAQNENLLTSDEELEIKWKLCAAYREEELYWRQKSRVLWLRGGDRNTRYFHAKTKQRRARNRITRLMNSMNDWVYSAKDTEAVASGYFHDLFTTSNPNTIEDTIRYITEEVIDEMNKDLLAVPHDEEIREATFAISTLTKLLDLMG